MTLDRFIFSILVFLHKLGSSAIKGHFHSVLISNIILYTSLSFRLDRLLYAFCFLFSSMCTISYIVSLQEVLWEVLSVKAYGIDSILFTGITLPAFWVYYTPVLNEKQVVNLHKILF